MKPIVVLAVLVLAGSSHAVDKCYRCKAANAIAELTAAMKLSCAQTMLDLAKAFDKAPGWVLVREAIRLGYPLWLLRLALAA